MTRRARLLGSLLVLAAVLLWALAPASSESGGSQMLVAAQDLPAGHRLAAEDLRTVRVGGDWAEDAAPLRPEQAVGKKLAVPVRASQQIGSTLFVAQDLAEGLGEGQSVVSLRVRDPESLALFAPGTRVAALGRTAEGTPVDVRGTLLWAGGPAPEKENGSPLGAGHQASEDQNLVLVAMTPEDARTAAGVDGESSLVVDARG